MGRKYRFHDNSKLYFVTFTVVNWIDVFTRKKYVDIIYDSLRFCQKEKGLELYAYCIMTNHIHLIIGTESRVLSDIVRDFKSFTSRHIRKTIENSNTESRKLWMLEIMKELGSRNERNKDFQFWQQHSHPIELDTNEILDQRLNYIHQNPVKAGFVEKEEDWINSSASDYYQIRKGQVDLIIIE
ncbi:transposase [Pedobacter psychrodurus]|uniref:Transposase n=1 Tax=Pedobacter psychrodurus TaxID=2530456 RepID=A0A4V2MQT5_9SPHI|nr:transposase [Pedobacter psychrodurus]TCD26348.1 transposase [Pedobacter psychrodurus]